MSCDAFSAAHLMGLYVAAGSLSSDGVTLRLRLRPGGHRAADHASAAVVLLSQGAAQVRVTPGPPAQVANTALEATWAAWREILPPSTADGRPALTPERRAEALSEPEALLAGLLTGGGTRVINRFTATLRSGRRVQYAYPRYFFTSPSAEAQRLFRAACARLGLDCTRSRARTTSVAHRRSVAALDALRCGVQ